MRPIPQNIQKSCINDFSSKVAKLRIVFISLTLASICLLRSDLVKGAMLDGSQSVTDLGIETPYPKSAPRFSENPSTADLNGTLIYRQRLTLLGGNKPVFGENGALATAVMKYFGGISKEDVSALNGFIAAFPKSGWNASILTNLGDIYRKYGYYSKALDAWQKAWSLSKQDNTFAGQQVANHSVAELVHLYSSLGRTEQLKPILDGIKGRPIAGPDATTILNAKESLAIMKKDPGISFRCGPFALGSIQRELYPMAKSSNLVLSAESSPKGFSMQQLARLAKAMKLNLQLAKRTADAPIIVPSVVHWKSGHYAAILKREGSQFLVRDPTFEGEALLSLAALNDESSGYFLIPEGSLPQGWTTIESKEASKVWGRGFPAARDPYCTKCNDQWAGGDCAGSCSGESVGMTTYSIKLLLACLHLGDTPLTYHPPVGPDLTLTVGYNQYENASYQPSIYNTANFGSNWVCNWTGFIVDAPTAVPTSSQGFSNFYITLPFGGVEQYSSSLNPYTSTGTNSGYYGIQAQGQVILYVKPSPSYSGQLRYERHMPDGSMEVYDSQADAQGNIYLSQVIDPQGNGVTLNYLPVPGYTNYERLATVSDQFGHALTFNYTLSGSLSNMLKITSIQDPCGRSAVFTYSSTSPYSLVSITDVAGMTSSFQYNSGTSAISALTTPYGTTTFVTPTSAYDTSDRTLIVTDPRGGQEEAYSRFEPDVFGGTPVEATPPQSTYSWVNVNDSDGDNDLEEMNTYYWDKRAMLLAPGNLTQCHIYHWQADEYGFVGPTLYCEKDALESRIWYNYTPSLELLNAEYEGASDRPIGVVRLMDDGSSQYSQSAYNSVGNVSRTIDPLGRSINYDYDTTVTNNIDVTFVRETTGSDNNVLLQLTYDPSYPTHRPKSIIDASGETTQYTYNVQGQVTSITQPDGEVTSFTYNGIGGTGSGNYLSSVSGPGPSGGGGDTTYYTYDSYGRVNQVTDSQGRFAKFNYDALDRVTLITYPDGTFEEFTYNKLDLQWHKDRLGNWTHNIYDAVRHLVSTTDPLGRTTAYQWCVCGALSAMTDGRGNTTQWNRDIQSRVTSKVYADGSQIHYVYESTTSRLKSMTDAEGQETDYSYNDDNTLAGIAYNHAQHATPKVGFSYDQMIMRLTGMMDGNGATGYCYKGYTLYSSWPPAPSTGVGRLTGEYNTLVGGNSSSPSISYTYDSDGRSLGYSIVDPGSSTNNYVLSYDSLGRVHTVANGLGTFTNGYLGTTSLISSVTYPSATGVVQANAYYSTANPQDIERLQEIKFTNGSTNISKFDYSYDAEGDITTWQQQNDSSPASAYGNTYDAANQLSEALLTNSGNTVHRYAYGYDGAGNRTADQMDATVSSGSFNNLNQLQSMQGGGAMRFSGTINQVGTVTLNGGAATMSTPTSFTGQVSTSTGTNVVTVVAKDSSGYAATNKYQVVTAPGAVEAVTFDADGNETRDGSRSYEWDAANRLTAINYLSNGSRSQFSYDGLGRRTQIVEKLDNNVTSTKQFVFVGNTVAEERGSTGSILNKQFYPQGQVNGSTPYYYTRDHLGSVRELLGGNGGIVSRTSYDPYGNATALTSGAALPEFGYAGMYLHSVSSLNLTLYRAYDPVTARWLSRDPLGEGWDATLYSYVWNSPSRRADRLGLGPPDMPLGNLEGGGAGPIPIPEPAPMPEPAPTPEPAPEPAPKPEPQSPEPTGNLRTVKGAKLKADNIDAHACKRDFVGRNGGRYNISVNSNGEVTLTPVQPGSVPSIPTHLPYSSLPTLYPLK